MTTRILCAIPRLLVRDVRQAAEWYRDQLGFEITEYFPTSSSDPQFVIICRDQVDIQLTRSPEPDRPGNAGNPHPGGIYLHVSGIEQLCDEVRSRGVELLYELETFSYGMKEFALLDADGHYIGFGEDAASSSSNAQRTEGSSGRF